MQTGFNFSASPFDCLNPAQRQRVRDSIDIAYFREGETILAMGDVPAHLFVVIKGRVRQLDDQESVAVYGPDDCFNQQGLVAGRVSSPFVAAEEVVAYQLARQAVMELISSNATFGALLFADLSRKLGALGQAAGMHEMQSLMMARVGDAFLRPAHMVDAQTDVLSVVEIFHSRRTSNVLVRDSSAGAPRLGIFTTTGLQRAVLGPTPLGELPVGRLASFPLVTVRPTDHVFDAMASMIRHKVHRVVVAEGERIVGVMEQLDVLSFLSNHSYLITVQMVQAEDLEALKLPARQIQRLIALLHRGGTKVALIAKLVQEINATLFERAWQLIAPPDLVDNCCLFVMGSEGRGEQLLKTDQDNGLILRDGYECEITTCRAASASASRQALGGFGYPECPGAIMVRQPTPGAQSSLAFEARRCATGCCNPSADSLMDLAIFPRAHAVGGRCQAAGRCARTGLSNWSAKDDALLRPVRRGDRRLHRKQTAGGTGCFSHRRGGAGQQINLKKAGIFPPGARRSLPWRFQRGVTETGTVGAHRGAGGRGQLSAQTEAPSSPTACTS